MAEDAWNGKKVSAHFSSLSEGSPGYYQIQINIAAPEVEKLSGDIPSFLFFPSSEVCIDYVLAYGSLTMRGKESFLVLPFATISLQEIKE